MPLEPAPRRATGRPGRRTACRRDPPGRRGCSPTNSSDARGARRRNTVCVPRSAEIAAAATGRGGGQRRQVAFRRDIRRGAAIGRSHAFLRPLPCPARGWRRSSSRIRRSAFAGSMRRRICVELVLDTLVALASTAASRRTAGSPGPRPARSGCGNSDCPVLERVATELRHASREPRPTHGARVARRRRRTSRRSIGPTASPGTTRRSPTRSRTSSRSTASSSTRGRDCAAMLRVVARSRARQSAIADGACPACHRRAA